MKRFLVAAALLTSSEFARAQAPGDVAGPDTPAASKALQLPTSPVPPALPSYMVRRYTWQLVAADVASISMIALGSRLDSAPLTEVGIGGLLLGAPAVHFAQHNSEAAVKSFSLRSGLTLLGGLVGYYVGPTRSNGCTGPLANDPLCDPPDKHSTDGALIGAAAGFVGALVVDYVYLGKKVSKLERQSWQPTVTVSERGMAIGAVGRF